MNSPSPNYTSFTVWAIILVLISVTSALGSDTVPMLPERFKPLVEDAQRNTCPGESELYGEFAKTELSSAEIEAIVKWLINNVDYRSLFVLLVLKDKAPNSYETLSVETRAKILISSLQNTNCLNDWGNLTPEQSYDDTLAKGLIALGKRVLPILRPVLDDKKDALLFGSEEATISRGYGYRRCDFAFRYIQLIRGKKPVFEEKPAERDKLIQECKHDLELELKNEISVDSPAQPPVETHEPVKQKEEPKKAD